MTRFLISAPTSGAGKTTLTLGLLRAFVRRGIDIHPAKSGPDYIDPAFHQVAAGKPSVNLDAWSMGPAQIKQLSAKDNLLVEGAMGLFDGAGLAGTGSAAHLARMLHLPVVLVLDAGKMAHSVAALAQGFVKHDPDVNVAGVILNRVGSPRHEAMLRNALAHAGITVFGCVYRSPALALPERHLGLVQASEHLDLDAWIDAAADLVAAQVDMDALADLTVPVTSSSFSAAPPPGQHIAVARDVAFEFCYPHVLHGWCTAGVQVSPFSPLLDQPVPDGADFVFLPGGYPELHAGQLAAATTFMASLAAHAKHSPVYGECGGYMVLGEGLVDKNGVRHAMAGLLPLETSFAERKLHLGYRRLKPRTSAFAGVQIAHEFHYSTTLRCDGPALFDACDADDADLGQMGLHIGQVYGSFAHLISGI